MPALQISNQEFRHIVLVHPDEGVACLLGAGHLGRGTQLPAAYRITVFDNGRAVLAQECLIIHPVRQRAFLTSPCCRRIQQVSTDEQHHQESLQHNITSASQNPLYP